jgi:DNA polymerase I
MVLLHIKFLTTKGLRGDTSDNIIGVKGIGEKTATDLIQKYETIENLYKVLEKNDQKLLDDGFKPRGSLVLLREHEEEARSLVKCLQQFK